MSPRQIAAEAFEGLFLDMVSKSKSKWGVWRLLRGTELEGAAPLKSAGDCPSTPQDGDKGEAAGFKCCAYSRRRCRREIYFTL